MAVPLTKVQRYKELFPRDRPVTPQSAKMAILDLKRSLKNVSTAEAADIYDFLGYLLGRSQSHEESLHYLELAARLDPARLSIRINQSNSLLGLGRPREAVDVILDALDQAPAYEGDAVALLLCNLAAALASLDLNDESDAALDRCEEVLPTASSFAWWAFSEQLAALGYEARALRTLALLLRPGAEGRIEETLLDIEPAEVPDHRVHLGHALRSFQRGFRISRRARGRSDLGVRLGRWQPAASTSPRALLPPDPHRILPTPGARSLALNHRRQTAQTHRQPTT